MPCAFATSVWLKFVFQRYEVTVALPIEYGALNFFSVMGGLIFFREVDQMSSWQLALALGGLALIFCGIVLPFVAGRKDAPPAAGGRLAHRGDDLRADADAADAADASRP